MVNDYYIPLNRDFSTTINFEDETGLPIDISGWTIQLTITDHCLTYANSPYLSKDFIMPTDTNTQNGIAIITLIPSDLSGVKPGVYTWELDTLDIDNFHNFWGTGDAWLMQLIR